MRPLPSVADSSTSHGGLRPLNDMAAKIDVPFYSDTKDALLKAIVE